MILNIKTHSQTEFLDITALIKKTVESSGVSEGACLIYVPHTTAGVTINESADPAVAEDILMVLNQMVPWKAPYRHSEGNSPAHVKASLMGSSVMVGVADGELALGTWQGIFFCEFDGPRNRTVHVRFLEGIGHE